MPPALSLSHPHIPLCKSQGLTKDHAHIPKISIRHNPSSKANLDVKLGKRELLNATAVGLLSEGLSVAKPARAEPESPAASTSSRMSYSRFLQYLDEGAVRKVDLFENGTVAIAEIFNPTLEKIQRVKIQLPGLPQ